MMSTSTSSSSNNNNIDQIKNRVALLQLPVTSDKCQNIETAKSYIQKAYESGAQLCVLPEIWNSPYATSAFSEYAETLPNVGDSLQVHAEAEDGETTSSSEWGASSVMLMEMASSTKMYIVGGSIPEVVCTNTGDDKKIYNTCLVINPSGEIVAKHRKVHLFDVNVPGGIQFKESETLSAGEGVTYFDVDDDEDDESSDDGLGRIGVGIWYVQTIFIVYYSIIYIIAHSVTLTLELFAYDTIQTIMMMMMKHKQHETVMIFDFLSMHCF